MPITINTVSEITTSDEFTGTAGAASPLTLAAAGVENDKLGLMPAGTIKGNDDVGAATPQDLTITEVLSMIVKGEYASDSAAASGGVSVGEVYELSAANIYGMPAGILKKRKS